MLEQKKKDPQDRFEIWIKMQWNEVDDDAASLFLVLIFFAYAC